MYPAGDSTVLLRPMFMLGQNTVKYVTTPFHYDKKISIEETGYARSSKLEL